MNYLVCFEKQLAFMTFPEKTRPWVSRVAMLEHVKFWESPKLPCQEQSWAKGENLGAGFGRQSHSFYFFGPQGSAHQLRICSRIVGNNVKLLHSYVFGHAELKHSLEF